MKQPQKRDRPSDGVRPQPPTAFDLWLDRGLHQMFDDVANEAVPQTFLDVIENHPKRQ